MNSSTGKAASSPFCSKHKLVGCLLEIVETSIYAFGKNA